MSTSEHTMEDIEFQVMEVSEHTMEDIEFQVMEVSEMDKALLMSLLNELNEEVDEANDATLEGVTKATENEIFYPELNMGNPSLTVEDYQFEDAALEDSQGCSVSSASSDSSLSYDMDNFDWINDMDMDSSVTSSQLSDDDEMAGINNWYLGTFRDEIEAGMIELRGLRDYDSELYYGVHQLEEQSYSSSLWQETYDSVVYG